MTLLADHSTMLSRDFCLKIWNFKTFKKQAFLCESSFTFVTNDLKKDKNRRQNQIK